ncbi:MAG: hypothetical protein P4L84_28125 [Isosphaeraceae bacterium]|nr:hypothetical protein [Isosphaeraceae bacterium]
MTTPERRRKVLPNPFFVLLLISSTAFVVTALMYYVSPMALQRSMETPSPGSRPFLEWLDKRGPLVLGVEFVVMCMTGVVAMATDDWFAPVKKPKPVPNPGPKDAEAT